MSSLLGHCHGENWKSPTRSFERSGKAKRTFEERKRTLFVCLRCTYDFSNPFLFDYNQPSAVVYNLLSRPFVHYEVVKL